MSFAADDASPTSSLPSSPSTSATSLNGSISGDEGEYRAPLNGEAPEPSIDGTSVAGGEGGVRATSAEEVGDEEKKLALHIKSQANALFSQSKYRDSLDLYTASLNKNPFDAIVWSNRAAVRLKLEEHGLAIADATRAIELDPRAVKAYFRRGIANLAVLKPKAALVDLKKVRFSPPAFPSCVGFPPDSFFTTHQVVQLDPNNAPAKSQLDATQKLIRRLAFEAAISSKDEVLTSIKIKEQLEQGGSPIDSDYKGPRLPEDGLPTAEFVEEMMQWFKDSNVLPRRLAWQIILGAYDVLKEEETLVDVEIPEGQTINIIGDTHGQYYDFLHLLSLTGKPSPTHSLLFNGDFVDRGSWSTEILLTLFAYKCAWSFASLMLKRRGLTDGYGFEGEMKKKYSELTYKLCEEVFIALPLATLVSASSPPRIDATPNPPNPTLHLGKKRFFVVHGGLFSKDSVTLADIRAVPRKTIKQPGQEGLMCEMLWCDPQDAVGRGPSKRGVGLGFGPDVTSRWTEANEVTAVIRSHEVRQGGYSVEHGGLLITVFSAPNYVDQVGNLAAFATIDETGEIEYTTFKEQPHPTHIRPMQYAEGMGMMGM
ncbi:SPOSA6832_04688 [Sporobolomyces salmonicolor]|uniref:protein-serine/threonine phosphatase n=1 Tax=Sporidiobolus salmonicolor TaxID=5005 RepID=A0A0D6ESN2_SPOSA|nr:SPOSA6832_04688 [Sporobolomyces salmonicolor]